MVETTLPTDPPSLPLTLVMGSLGQNSSFYIMVMLAFSIQHSTFSEHGHVAYQIKENHECSHIVENILPADSDPP